MSRLNIQFKKLKKQGIPALITYICAGDPDLEITKQLVLELERSGADIIELGIPFSDPIADGPVIQRSAQRALLNKTRLIDVIQLVNELRQKTRIPILFMSYYNPIYRLGVEQFVKLSTESGLDGVIIPDLPPDEADDLIKYAKPAGFDTVFLLAPTSTEKRIKLVSQKSTGFIYYVSLTGVTGTREKIAEGVESYLTGIRKYTDKPICVGFGISKPDQIKQLAGLGVDGIIVGSAIVAQIEKYNQSSDITKKVGSLVSELAKGRIKNQKNLL